MLSEIKEIVWIIRLEYDKAFTSVSDLKALCYCHFMITTNQNKEGSSSSFYTMLPFVRQQI